MKSPGILLLVFVSSWFACNEPVPGCLDIQAENFDFDADEHDPSHCVYPALILNVNYQWDTTAFNTGVLYQNQTGRSFAIHGVQVLFSDFRITDDNGNVYQVEDRMDVRRQPCQDGATIEIVDDFVFVDRSSFNYVIGGLRASGNMRQVQLHTGVSEAYGDICPESLGTDHLLRSPRAGYLPETGEYAIGRFVVSLDSIHAERDTLFVYQMSEQLSFDILREFRLGKKDTLYMALDFARMFRQVDWNAEDSVVTATIASEIVGAVQLQ